METATSESLEDSASAILTELRNHGSTTAWPSQETGRFVVLSHEIAETTGVESVTPCVQVPFPRILKFQCGIRNKPTFQRVNKSVSLLLNVN